MKQYLALAAMAAAAAPAAMAQSVTIYGIADAGVMRVTGYSGGSRNAVVSGIMEGSRLGVRGSEDLGGGYRAIFTLENRLELDTGSVTNRPLSGSQLPDRLSQATLLGLPAAAQPTVTSVAAALGNNVGVNLAGNFWDRQIYVGLVTPVGAVLAGRQYTPAYEISAAFDTLSTQSSLAVGQVASFPPAIDIRVSNAVAYRIQQGPLSGSLMVAAGEGSAATGRLIGGNAMYKTEAFAIGFGHNTRRNENAQKSLMSTVLGASLNVGPGTAFLEFMSIKDDNPSGLNGIRTLLGAPGAGVAAAFTNALKQDARLMHLGYKMTTGLHTAYVAYTMLDDRRPSNGDVASYGAAYSYALSKRTDLNFVLTHFNNKNLAQAAPGQAGFLGGVTASAGTDSNVVAVGVRHRF